MFKITIVRHKNATFLRQRINFDGIMIGISWFVNLWTSCATRMKTDVVTTRLTPALSGMITNISVKENLSLFFLYHWTLGNTASLIYCALFTLL